jgi:hypothetical protein
MIYEETRGVLKTFLEGVIRDAVTYTEHAKRKTVTSLGKLSIIITFLQCNQLNFYRCCLRSQETGAHTLWFRWLNNRFLTHQHDFGSPHLSVILHFDNGFFGFAVFLLANGTFDSLSIIC